MTVLRVVLADDHPLMLFGLVQHLEGEAGLDVVAAVGSWAELVAAVAQHQPHVVVADVSMPGGSILDALPELRQASATARVLCLSEGDSDTAAVSAALALGADGVVSKQSDGARVASSIRAAAAGQIVLDLREAGTVKPALSPREHRVLELVAAGYTTSRIAADLLIAPATVKTYLESLYDKLRVRSRAAAVAVAKDLGLLGAVSPD